MPGLRKHQLLEYFEQSIRDSGATVLYLNKPGSRPSQYHVSFNGERISIVVYIWTITHGGRTRSASEYRIQVTGINEFATLANTKTIIVGYYPNNEIFAAFDPKKHTGRILGSSPSMQVSVEALLEAEKKGFAIYQNNKGEIVATFQPGLLVNYLRFQEQIHESGEIPEVFEVFQNISSMDDEQVQKSTGTLDKNRQFAIISSKRAIRDSSFRNRVLSAYKNRCSICGVQLKLIDAAHILSASDPKSSDDTSNGIALCSLHHRAYDSSLITFLHDYKIILNEKKFDNFKNTGFDGGLVKFLNQLPISIRLPADNRDFPAPNYIKQANILRGWV